VCEQVLHRHGIADEREVAAKDRTCGRGHSERAVLDQAGDRERGQPLGPAGDRETSVDGVPDAVGAIRESVGPCELRFTVAIHAHDAGEAFPVGDGVDRVGQR
jgi:hypothetical protein